MCEGEGEGEVDGEGEVRLATARSPDSLMAPLGCSNERTAAMPERALPTSGS